MKRECRWESERENERVRREIRERKIEERERERIEFGKSERERDDISFLSTCFRPSPLTAFAKYLT